MKTLTMEQGSPEWLMARLGKPTASQFDRLLTPAKLKPSAQRWKYMNELLAEYVCGYPIDFGGSSMFMDRGTELEPRARAWYAFDRDTEVEEVGFVMRDDERVGGSPDGLVGSDGLLELKCPSIQVHIGYLLDPAALESAYVGQCQGLLYLTGRAWIDLVAFNPDLPAVARRVEPDAKYHAALGEVLDGFLADLDEAKEKLAEYRNEPVEMAHG